VYQIQIRPVPLLNEQSRKEANDRKDQTVCNSAPYETYDTFEGDTSSSILEFGFWILD
jgi:hypothetical protein